MEVSTTTKLEARSAFARYALAGFGAVAAILLRQLLSPLLGIQNPYHTVWMAVIFAAWYCGIGPSIVAVLISWLGVYYLFLPPNRSFAMEIPKEQIAGMLGFFVFSGFIIALGESNRRSRSTLESEIEERRRTEEDLRLRDRELNEAQRLATMGSWQWDPQSNIVSWSDGLYRMSGLDLRTPPLGFPENQRLFAPESWQRLKAAVERTLQTGEGYDLELEMLRPDGTSIITMTHAEAERDASGRVVRLFGSIQDITDIKRAQQALRESEQLLRIAQKASRSGSWESNYKTGQVMTSPELRELYGFSPEHENRSPEFWRSMIDPGDLARLDRYHSDLIAARGSHFHVEFRVHPKDGALRWLDASAHIFYDEQGQPERIVGVATDTTVRKQIEERERALIAESLAATAKFRAVFEQTSVFAGITNIDGTVIDANQLCLDACGYRSEQVLGFPLWQTPWWSRCEESQEKIRVATEQAAQGIAFRDILHYHWADGTEHIVDFGLHPIRDAQGQIIFLHPTGVDITDLKQTEEHLRKAQEELETRVADRTGELAETVASLEAEVLVRKKMEHDLRLLSARVLRLQDEERRRIARDLHDSTGQTLAALRMTLAGLERWVGSVPEASPLLREADHLSNQALQEIRTTSYLLHPPLLDEVGFASAAQWYVEGFTSRSGIAATLHLGPVPELEKESELALFRILQESLSNVHRHAESSRVEIRLAADRDNAILSIRDFGKGMPAEKFASFQETGTGVGVGLGGMKQRVRGLGGHLRVETSGEGTCVIATLPLTGDRCASKHSDPDQTEAPAA